MKPCKILFIPMLVILFMAYLKNNIDAPLAFLLILKGIKIPNLPCRDKPCNPAQLNYYLCDELKSALFLTAPNQEPRYS